MNSNHDGQKVLVARIAEQRARVRGHTAVSDACVVGLPDPEWGQVVAAMVVLTEPNALTAEQLIAYSRQHLAGYKQPRYVQFVN